MLNKLKCNSIYLDIFSKFEFSNQATAFRLEMSRLLTVADSKRGWEI